MSLLDRILNRTPEMKELYVMETPKYGTFGQEDKPRVTFEALAGIKNKVGNKINSFYDSLIGVDKTEETPVVNTDGTVQAGLAKTQKSGFIPDLMSGFKENATESFNPKNLAPDENKGLAFKIGEGLGTAIRFLDSPFGRGLAVAGTVGALGGSGGDALAYGLNTTAKNQGLRMQDRIYRNDLKQHEINSLMASPEFALMDADTKKAALAAVEEKYNNMGGYITGDAYKNILASRQMQENAEWRKANLMADLRQNDIYNNIRLRELKLKEDEAKRGGAKAKAAYQKFRQAISDRNGAIQQIRDLKTYITQNPNALGLIVGSLAKGNEISQKLANETLSSAPEHIKTRAAVAKLRGTTMHDLLGSAQTLVEQKNLVPFLPDATDNPKTALAKLDQLEKEIQRELNNMYVHGDDMGWDYATQEPPQITTNNVQPKTNDLPAAPKKIGKYTVEVQ